MFLSFCDHLLFRAPEASTVLQVWNMKEGPTPERLLKVLLRPP